MHHRFNNNIPILMLVSQDYRAITLKSHNSFPDQIAHPQQYRNYRDWSFFLLPHSIKDIKALHNALEQLDPVYYQEIVKESMAHHFHLHPCQQLWYQRLQLTLLQFCMHQLQPHWLKVPLPQGTTLQSRIPQAPTHQYPCWLPHRIDKIK